MKKIVAWFCGGVMAFSAFASSAADKILVTEAFHSLLYLPVYVAKHQGLFEKNNIDVTSVRSAGSGPTALAAVLGGEAQFSVHGPEHVAFAQQKGGSVKAVSAVANSAPVWVLAKADFTFNSPASLKGKRIVVGQAPGTSNTLLLRLLKQNNIDPKKDVRLIEVQNGSELGPILAGQADVAVAYEPQADQGIGQGLKVVYDFTKDYPQYAFSTINTSEKLIKEQPQLVQRFVDAINASLALIHQNPALAQQIARQEFPSLDGKLVDSAVQRMIASNVYPTSAVVTPDAYQTAMEIQQFVGNLSQTLPYSQVVTTTFFTKE